MDDEKRVGNQERWAGKADDIKMLGGVKRTHDATSDEDKAAAADHRAELDKLRPVDDDDDQPAFDADEAPGDRG